MEFFAEGCDVTADAEMVTAIWTAGDPPRTQAIMHMSRRHWWAFITSVHERQLGAADGTSGH